jgi:hypothetical protein
MKKKLFPIMLGLILVSGFTFANNENVTPVVLNNSTTSFNHATNVNWEKTGNFYKATFWMDGKELYAIFSKEGHKVAIARNILSTELPDQLHASLNNNFPKYWITDLFEYNSHGETRYYVTIENSEDTQILESIGTIEWSLFKKTTK